MPDIAVLDIVVLGAGRIVETGEKAAELSRVAERQNDGEVELLIDRHGADERRPSGSDFRPNVVLGALQRTLELLRAGRHPGEGQQSDH